MRSFHLRPTLPLAASILAISFLSISPRCTGAETAATVYLSDMSSCEPAAAVSKTFRTDGWRLIPFKSERVEGVMLGACSSADAPEVRLPLNHEGWHEVHLGIWNPRMVYDGNSHLRARLSSRSIFQQIDPGKSPDTHAETYIEEVHLCDADLSDEKYLAFGKSNGLQPRSAYVAYVKLVPMSQGQIRGELARRTDETRKNLVATIDGISLFHYSDCSTPERLLEWIEKLRHSDTKKVLWAVTYGDRTAFPTKNPDLSFLGAEGQFKQSALVFGNDYQRGQWQMHSYLKASEARGEIAQKALAEHAHSIGLEFDLMFRIGFLGGVGMSAFHHGNYVERHAEVRQVTRDGRALQKASLAFPAVQQLVLDQIEESCRVIDADGINLCFVRGPHFLLWEKPVRAAFEARFGESSENVGEDDPRVDEVRAAIMTKFLKRVRAKLDELGAARDRKLSLSAWVWPYEQDVWLGKKPMDEGLDVRAWIEQGLLDSVICQEGIDRSYIELGKKNDCEFVLFSGYRGEKAMSPATVLAAREQGVEAFAYWDMDAVQNRPTVWRWLRQTGDQDRLRGFIDDPKRLARRLVLIDELNGYDLKDGSLVDAVFSGG